MQNLRSALNELASSFTDSVLEAIRSASIDELMAQTGHSPGGNGRRSRSVASPAPKAAAPSKASRTTSSGRLARRTDEEISSALDGVVALVKKNREGLRAEQIRSELGLQPKELPRILKQGLSTRKLKSKGQKRATTYFAA
jgi:hypothetical protein